FDQGKEVQMSVPSSSAPVPAPSPVSPPLAVSRSASSSEYTRSSGFLISPEILQWIAPAALVLTLMLTVFPWNGAFPGGHSAYSQSLWGTLFGTFSHDKVADKVLRLVDVGSDEKPLKDFVHANGLMWLYFLLLLAA